MADTVAIGIQDFEKIIEKKCFYVDKTLFIKVWWESQDDVKRAKPFSARLMNRLYFIS